MCMCTLYINIYFLLLLTAHVQGDPEGEAEFVIAHIFKMSKFLITETILIDLYKLVVDQCQ